MAAARAYSSAQSWESSSRLTREQLAVVANVAERSSRGKDGRSSGGSSSSGRGGGYAYIQVPPHIRREREQRRVMEELERAAAKPTTKPATDGSALAGGGMERDGETTPDAAASGKTATEKADVGPGGGNETLSTASAFYTWWSEQEASVLREKERKYVRYAEELEDGLARCTKLSGEIDGVVSLLDDLRALHRSVGSKTQSLTSACDRLVAEERHLAEFADALRGKLEYFDEFERLAPHCQGPTQLSVSDSGFFTMMRRLDECIAFVADHPQYADSAAYAAKFKLLQTRALGSVRTHVFAALRQATQQVTAAAREARDANGVLPDGAETSVLYVKFRAAITELRSVIAEMEGRADKKDYAQLLTDCHAEYCEQRLALCMPVVEQRMSVFAAPGKSLDALVRSGCAYLLLLCRQEQQLFDFLFHVAMPSGAEKTAVLPATAGAGGPAGSVVTVGSGGSFDSGSSGGGMDERQQPLNDLLEPLADVLYDILRPSVLSLTDIDFICDLVNIVKGEIMEEQMGRYGAAVAPGLANVMKRILADMQERLTFRAQNFIRDEVEGFRPTDADLNYPGCLVDATSKVAGDASNGSKGDATATQQVADPKSAWYPPVNLTLSLLAKLYKCVDAPIFSGLAQEAIAACTIVVRDAHRQLSRRRNVEATKPADDDAAKASTSASALLGFDAHVDSSLFLIRQLLTLREQITPFEVDICVIEKELDFSTMADQLRRIAMGGQSLLSFSTHNPIITFMSNGVPRTNDIKLDSKLELDSDLTKTCEAFIMHVTKMVVEPMLSFITKVTAVRVSSAPPLRSADSSASSSPVPVPSTPAKHMKEQAFATPDRVASIVSTVRSSITTSLASLVRKMHVYISDEKALRLVLNPIKANITEAHGQMKAIVDAEYDEGDKKQMMMMDGAGLETLLTAAMMM